MVPSSMRGDGAETVTRRGGVSGRAVVRAERGFTLAWELQSSDSPGAGGAVSAGWRAGSPPAGELL